jgi:hypothetical protein
MYESTTDENVEFFEKLERKVSLGRIMTTVILWANSIALIMGIITSIILGSPNILRPILWIFIMYSIYQGKRWAKTVFIIFAALGLFLTWFLIIVAGDGFVRYFELLGILPMFVTVSVISGVVIEIITLVLLVFSKSISEYMYSIDTR